MAIRFKAKLCVIFLIATSAAVLFIYSTRTASTAVKGSSDVSVGNGDPHNGPNGQAVFLVDTPGCRIPNVEPFDVSVRHLVTSNENFTVHCRNYTLPPLTFIDENRYLRVNRTALVIHYHDELDYCSYETIYRPTEDQPPIPVDNRFGYRRPVQFTDHVDLAETQTEFLRVACFGRHSGMMIYVNFHAVVLRKPTAERSKLAKLKRFRKTRKPAWMFNFLLIGVDSVSRLNFMRQMPLTRRFLIDQLGAFELQGYNKVADNTYVNLVPMFAGKFVEELPWDERLSEVPFDNYTFFWNQLSDRGYWTLYAEDAPSIAIFNYNKAGFHKPPAEYYLRPFSLALEDHGSLWSSGRDCVGSRLETEIVLDYIVDFERRFRKEPHMSFAFLTRLTHEDVRKTASADLPYFRFLQQLKDESLLDKTVVVFYSDHGIRFGELRETYVGKLEERLPFMYVVLPPAFIERYPAVAKSLTTNTARLTTPFDIYATLGDLMDFDGRPIRPNDISRRGCSLLADIPSERTCESAAILPHWCTCHATVELPVSDGQVAVAADGVLRYINNIVSVHDGRCSTLTLAAVIKAFRIVPNDDVMRFRNSRRDVIGRTVEFGDYGVRGRYVDEYQLTIKTAPGDALFEATVLHRGNLSTVDVAFVSRINAYGDQSVCIDYHSHKKFCHCV